MCIRDRGLPDDDAGELPAAVVVLEHGKTMTEKEIVDYVASQVTTAKKLRGRVVFVDEVPKGLTGKLDARKIREILIKACLLYTSDAADDLLCVDLGGRRIIKKKKKH